MKTRALVWLFVLCGVSVLIGCGSGTTGNGGTETGSTTIDTSQLATRMNAVGASLVPNMVTGSNSSISVTKAISYGSSSDWDQYTNDSNNYVLTDIFGSASVSPQVVTKIRVLLSQYANTVSSLFSQDPDIDCTGATALAGEDSINVAFYGTISNGTSSDRYFDCVEVDGNTTTIYGQDSAGIVRIVSMSDQTSTNTESVSDRGDQSRIRQVVYSIYSESSESVSTVAYLDLSYAQMTNYNGVDDDFGTADDVIFKSRSRITGRATLDSTGTPSLATGEFTNTKYDKSASQTDAQATVTQTLGRGNFADGEHSLFKVDSNVSSLASIPGTFCIQMPTNGSGLPSDADSSNCTTLEYALAWGATTFPFTLSPEISADFTSQSFYNGNDTDMISNDGSNFTIPTY